MNDVEKLGILLNNALIAQGKTLNEIATLLKNQKPTVVNVAPPEVTISDIKMPDMPAMPEAPTINVEAPIVNVPQALAPIVNVEAPIVNVPPAEITVQPTPVEFPKEMIVKGMTELIAKTGMEVESVNIFDQVSSKKPLPILVMDGDGHVIKDFGGEFSAPLVVGLKDNNHNVINPATSDKQPSFGIAGTASTNVLTVQGIAGGTALPVSGSLAITGTVAVTQSTSPWVIAGAVTNTVLSVVGGGTEATAQRVTLASDTTGVLTVKQATAGNLNATVVGTGTFAVQSTPVTQADTFMLGGVNVKEINAVTPLMGNGATGTGSLRVTIASDNTAFSVNNTPVVPTTVGNNVKTVTTAGTRVALATTTTIKSVTIKALISNTGLIYVGNSTVAAANGFQLSAGDTISLDIADPSTINIDSAVNGEGVSFLTVN